MRNEVLNLRQAGVFILIYVKKFFYNPLHPLYEGELIAVLLRGMWLRLCGVVYA